MASKDKVHMPTSTAGLTRYFEDYRSRISFKPGHVVVLAIIIAAVVILLNMFGHTWLGF
jgi:preprotein translocase subunit Sec61beta